MLNGEKVKVSGQNVWDKVYGEECMAKKVRLDTNNIVVYEKKAWFFSINYPCLCCYDYEKQEILKKKFIYDKKGYIECLYEKIIRIENYIVGIPFWASQVFIYDTKTDEEYYLDIIGDEEVSVNAFYTSSICGNIIYSFRRFATTGESGNYVLKIDPFRKKAEYIKLCLDEVNYNDSKTVRIFANESYSGDGFVILLSEKGNILKLRLSDFKCDFFNCKNSEYPFYTISRFGDSKYFLTDRMGEGFIWDGQHNYLKVKKTQIIELTNKIATIEKKYMSAFENSDCYKDVIYLMPSWANIICEYDIKKNIMKKAWFSDEIVFDVINESKPDNYYVGFFSNTCLVANVLFLFCVSGGKFYEIDLEKKVVKSKVMEVDLNEEELTYIWKYRVKNSGGIIKEDKKVECELQTFINMMCKNTRGHDGQI